MEKAIETYLFDIQNAIGEIDSFFAGRYESMSFHTEYALKNLKYIQTLKL
jgi:hypothetical protein